MDSIEDSRTLSHDHERFSNALDSSLWCSQQHGHPSTGTRLLPLASRKPAEHVAASCPHQVRLTTLFNAKRLGPKTCYHMWIAIKCPVLLTGAHRLPNQPHALQSIRATVGNIAEAASLSSAHLWVEWATTENSKTEHSGCTTRIPRAQGNPYNRVNQYLPGQLPASLASFHLSTCMSIPTPVWTDCSEKLFHVMTRATSKAGQFCTSNSHSGCGYIIAPIRQGRLSGTLFGRTYTCHRPHPPPRHI